MKTYTTIENNISKFLDLKDTYRYLCLSFTPTKENNTYTDSTFKQIMFLTGDTSEETIKDFVARLRKSEYIKIETYQNEFKIKRNKYYMKPLEENYRRISNGIIGMDLPIAYKGFLIQLFGLCKNLTNYTEFTNKEIASRLDLSEKTISTYTRKLVELGHLKKLKKGFELLDECFMLEVKKEILTKLQEIEELKIISEKYKFEYGDNYISQIIDTTNWETIKFPMKYIRAIEAGFANKKIEKDEEIVL